MWHTLGHCWWASLIFFIRLVEIFLTISIVSLLEFWYASKMFFYFFFYFFSLFYLIRSSKKGREEWQKKISWRHVEALIVKPLVLLKKSWRDKSQNTIKRILTVTRVCHTSHSKVNESQYIWITRVVHSGNRLWSFFKVVEFVSSISFKWYRWCHRQSFDVFI